LEELMAEELKPGDVVEWKYKHGGSQRSKIGTVSRVWRTWAEIYVASDPPSKGQPRRYSPWLKQLRKVEDETN
jgi:hypothetical protein